MSLSIANQKVISQLQRIPRAGVETEIYLTQILQLLHSMRNHFNWIGIYFLNNNMLILRPYIGKPSPHTHIALNTGICGAAASTGKTIIVEDVKYDPRYLACSIETQSEIVVPIIDQKKILGEIDVDSDQLAAFSAEDQSLLEAVAELIAPLLKK